MVTKTWTFASGWKVGDKIEDQYEIRKIHLGNMGAVFICVDLETQTPVAVKTFQKTHVSSEQSRRVFMREVGTWIRLDPHPNIVRAYFLKIIEDKPYLFLEFVATTKTRGANLKEYMSNRPFCLHETLDLVIQACDGMIHAASCVPGMVHRDLKPENLLLTPDMTVKITDFGLVHSQIQPLNGTRFPIGRPTESAIAAMAARLQGTPAYISPEQCRCDTAVDVRSDVYSFGCLLFELVARQKPFEEAKTVEENIRAHLVETPRRLRTLVPAVPPELDDLVHRCLQKQPTDRPADFQVCRRILGDLYTDLTGKRLAPRRAEPFSVTSLVNKGVSLMETGCLDEALATLKKASQLDPKQAEPHNFMGAVYYRMRRFDEAIACFQKATDCDPSNAMAHCNLGAALEEKKRTEEAEAAYKEALKQDPSLSAAAYNLSLLYEASRRFREALDLLTRLRDKSAGGPKIDQRLAELYFKTKRYDKASRHLEKALEQCPNDDRLYLLSGAIKAAKGWAPAAIEEYKKAIEFNPENAEAHYRLGLLYHGRKRQSEAVKEWERAIEINPKHGLAHYNLAVALAMRRRYPMAWIYIREAEKLGVNVSKFIKELHRLSPEPKQHPR